MATTITKYQKNEQGQFICTHCDYTARIQSTMHYHLKKHEGALPHACKHCNQKFLQKGLLDLHISARHKETLTEKQETFQCCFKGCEYNDIRKGNRLIHYIRVHLKKFTDSLREKSQEEKCVSKCKSCQTSFKSMTQFYYHASNCINLSEDHALYNEWIEIRK